MFITLQTIMGHHLKLKANLNWNFNCCCHYLFHVFPIIWNFVEIKAIKHAVELSKQFQFF